MRTVTRDLLARPALGSGAGSTERSDRRPRPGAIAAPAGRPPRRPARVPRCGACRMLEAVAQHGAKGHHRGRARLARSRAAPDTDAGVSASSAIRSEAPGQRPVDLPVPVVVDLAVAALGQ